MASPVTFKLCRNAPDIVSIMSENQTIRTKFQTVDEGMKDHRRRIANEHIADSERKAGAKNRTRILYFIASREPEGASTSKQKAELHLHRDTIHTICEGLKDEGLVTKMGKFGNYHVTTRAYQDPELTARIFFNESLRWIRSNTSPIVTLKEEEDDETCNKVRNYQEREWKDFWNKLYHIHSDLPEKKGLLEFAIDIGMLITYVMIEAVRPRCNKKYVGDIKNSNDNNKGIEVDLLPGEKRRQTELWVRNAINPYDILREFIRLSLVKRGLAEPEYLKEFHKKNMNPDLPEDMKKALLAKHRFVNTNNPSYSPYEIDEPNFRKLVHTFDGIWPWTLHRFSDIKNRLPDIMKSGYEQTDFNEKQLHKIKEKLRAKRKRAQKKS